MTDTMNLANYDETIAGARDGDLTVYLTDLDICALGRHRRMARDTLEDTSPENYDLDRALCHAGDDIDLETVRRTPTTQEEREIVIGALERIKGEDDLAMAAVARMEDDLRASLDAS